MPRRDKFDIMRANAGKLAVAALQRQRAEDGGFVLRIHPSPGVQQMLAERDQLMDRINAVEREEVASWLPPLVTPDRLQAMEDAREAIDPPPAPPPRPVRWFPWPWRL